MESLKIHRSINSEVFTLKGSFFVSRWLPTLIKPFVAFYYKSLNLLNKFRFDVWIISGVDPHIEQSFKVLYSGQPKNKYYLGELAFGDSYNELFIGRMWIWTLAFMVLKNRRDYAFMFFETRESLCRFLNHKNIYFVPDWVNAEIDLSMDMESRSRLNRSAKYNVKKIKKNKLEYKLSRENSHFDHFYKNMYLPYIRKRHHKQAVFRKYEEMKNSFQNGELLFIRKNGSYIAGVIIDYAMMHGIPRITQLGVLDGNTEYVDLGAISALYYYTMEYLKKQGHKKFYVGWSRPFLNDGVLNFKKNWGCKFSLESGRIFFFVPLCMNRFTKSFLINNPFINVKQKNPVGTVFVDCAQLGYDFNLEKLKKKYFLNGLTNVMVSDLSNDKIQKTSFQHQHV